MYHSAQFWVLFSFNILLADLFITLNNIEIANYADDTTIFVFPYNINDLSIFGNNLLHDNLLKSNPENRSIKIENSACEKNRSLVYYYDAFTKGI